MPSILAIPLILLALFTQGTLSEKPGILRVTFDPEFLGTEERLDGALTNVFYKEKKYEGMKKIQQNSDDFTIDWSNCPEKLENVSDLEQIRIRVTIKIGHKGRITLFDIELKEYSAELLAKFFAGGEARIYRDENGHGKLEYMEFPNELSNFYVLELKFRKMLHKIKRNYNLK